MFAENASWLISRDFKSSLEIMVHGISRLIIPNASSVSNGNPAIFKTRIRGQELTNKPTVTSVRRTQPEIFKHFNKWHFSRIFSIPLHALI